MSASNKRNHSKCRNAILIALSTVIPISSMPPKTAFAADAKARSPKAVAARRVAPPPPCVSDQLLVMAAKGTDSDEFKETMQAVHGTVIKTIGQGDMTCYVVQTEPGKQEETRQTLSKDEHIAIAQPNYIIRPQQMASVVNDPVAGAQWNLGAMRVPAAWPLSTGRGVEIAIPDNTVNPNVGDLIGKVDAGYSTNTHSYGQGPLIAHHGTMQSCISSARANNRINIAGIAPDSTIFPLTTADLQNRFTEEQLLEAISVAGHRGTRIISIALNFPVPYSLSNGRFHPIFHQYISWYHNVRNGTAFVAAGNEGKFDPNPRSADFIVVGSMNTAYNRSGFSNTGPIGLICPGEAIRTADMWGTPCAVNGTSFAAASAAGVMALLVAANPGYTNRQLENVLFSTAQKLGDSRFGVSNTFGYGLPNAAQAVNAVKLRLQ